MLVQTLSTFDYEYNHKAYDTASGLYYYGGRFYYPLTHRFITEDSTQYSSLDNPQTLNRYAYVLNNPVTLTDPNGHRVGFAGGGSGGYIDPTSAISSSSPPSPGTSTNGGSTTTTSTSTTTTATSTSSQTSQLFVGPPSPSQPNQGPPQRCVGVPFPPGRECGSPGEDGAYILSDSVIAGGGILMVLSAAGYLSPEPEIAQQGWDVGHGIVESGDAGLAYTNEEGSDATVGGAFNAIASNFVTNVLKDESNAIDQLGQDFTSLW